MDGAALNRMKIVVVHNAYQQRGGEDAVAAAECDLLRAHGHEVVPYYRNNTDIIGMFSPATAIQSLWSLRTTRDFSSLIRRVRPHVIHAHNTFPLISPSLYYSAAKARVPVVQTLHNFRLMCLNALLMRNGHICEDCMGRLPWRGVVRKCYRNTAATSFVLAAMLALHRQMGTFHRKVTRYIALTSFCRSKFIEAGLPARRIDIKPNFTDSPGSRSDRKRKRSALFVGRLSREKGIDTLLSSWKHLDDPILIAGDGPLRWRIRQFESSHVVPLGLISREKVHTIMSETQFLVMPSEWYEGFPMVIVEAFAHGLPIVASRLGSMAEIVEDGKTGLLFEPGNPRDLAEKARWMFEHPDACRRMGERARKEFESKYSPEPNYRELMKIYLRAMNEANHGAT